MRDPILACYTDDEDIYFIPDPDSPNEDGLVVRDGDEFVVPFWSYVNRIDGLTYINDDEYVDELWNGDTSSVEWQEEYFWHGAKPQE